VSEGFTITAKGMSPDQLAAIEERAGKRLLRMLPVAGHVGHITLATAALTMEIIEEAQPENNTMVFIVAVEDLRYIIESYLSRHTLSMFPYRNGQLLDYIRYANFYTIAACIG
jgi:hypothetical protein